MQLTINLQDCKKPGDIAAQLRMQANLFDGMSGKEASRTAKTANSEHLDPEETDSDTDGENDDFKKAASSTKSKKSAKAFEESAENEPEGGEEDFKTPAKGKAAKAKKLTIDDVNDACVAHAKGVGKGGRDAVLAILKKKFNVITVTELKPDQYEKAIVALEA